MDMQLVGRRALVTGASGGIGLAIARKLALRGASLVLAARSADRLDKHADEIGTAYGVAVERVAVDLSTPEGPKQLIDALAEKRIDIDVLVNNAGRGIHGDGLDHEWEDELSMLRLNILALAELTKHYGRAMRVRGRGWICQVASIAGFQPCPGYAAYAASKAFVLHHAESLADELRDSGVNVVALCPGTTNTEFFNVSGHERNALQMSTSMEPEAVARIAVRAMLKGKRTAIPGASNKLITFSARLLPRRLQAFLARKVLE